MTCLVNAKFTLKNSRNSRQVSAVCRGRSPGTDDGRPRKKVKTMIEKYKIIGDIFLHIKSERRNEDVFEQATKEIIGILKRYDFNVEETSALLSNINESINKISTDLAYSQELKNLF